jgi:uncharacterized protein YbjT (DUF2867 family)
MLGKHVMVVGATGLVGGFCLSRLLEEDAVERVVVLSRRSLGLSHEKLDEHLIQFDRLTGYTDLFDVDSLFCCLGTTLKAAGSRGAFEKVDFGYVKQIAELAAARNVRQFLLISALGSDLHSPVFYSRIKGRAEEAVRQQGFHCVHILRPSMLLGTRVRPRFNEEMLKPLAKLTLPMFVGPLQRLRPVQAEKVAGVMVELAKGDYSGVNIHYPSAL